MSRSRSVFQLRMPPTASAPSPTAAHGAGGARRDRRTRSRSARSHADGALGGNGGVHALDLARQLGIGRVVVPPLSGVFSAVGMLATDLAHIERAMIVRVRLTDMTVLRASRRDGRTLPANVDCAALPRRLCRRAHRARSGRPICATRARPANSRAFKDGDIVARCATASWPSISRPTAIATQARSSSMKISCRRAACATTGSISRHEDRGAGGGTRATSARDVVRPRRAGGVRADRRAAPLSAPAPAAGPLMIEEFDATIVVPPDATVHRDRHRLW